MINWRLKIKRREHEYNQDYYKKNKNRILNQQKIYRSNPEVRKDRSRKEPEREYRLGGTQG